MPNTLKTLRVALASESRLFTGCAVLWTIGGETHTRFDRCALLLGEESSHQLSQTTTFKQRLEVYPGLSGDKPVIAKFNAGLGVAMSSTLSLTVGLIDTYNSKPPAGLKKNDVGLFTGVSVKLGAICGCARRWRRRRCRRRGCATANAHQTSLFSVPVASASR